jgi:hypothetical protein
LAKKTTQERDYWNKDAVFMGLFDDINSPSVPANGVTLAEMLSDATFEKMNELVKLSLEIGFEVSPLDGGHLLFSAWNAAGKLCSWTSVCWEGPSTAATAKKQDVLERLICLRDDLCEVRHLFNRNEPLPHQQTLLEKTTSGKRGRCRPSEALISGITSSEQMFKHVLSELRASNDTTVVEVPTLPTFAYLEALPVYLSFLISMHSRPGSNNFSSIHRFSKSHIQRNKPSSSYTNEDVLDELPSDDSDFESFESGGQSLRNRALGRLHNACASLGAAPCYPDWLDTRLVFLVSVYL